MASPRVVISYSVSLRSYGDGDQRRRRPMFHGDGDQQWTAITATATKAVAATTTMDGDLTRRSDQNIITPTPPKDNKSLIIGLVAAAAASALLFLLVLGILSWIFFGWWQKRRTFDNADERSNQCDMEDGFENGAGPNRFSYDMLATATGNFSDSKKLGEGGFGLVYKGFLIKMNLDVAIKRMSKHSRQGWKEYISEITIISHLRHRNLVQLIGFCHTHDELLLIYNLMPNGSLDKHLHNQENILPWTH
ncbi:hypothetical protein EJB05_49695, partial [Eragrostis curvula]